MVNYQFSLVRLSFFFILILFMGGNSACEKHPSSNKVKRYIVDGTWKLTSAFIDNEDLSSAYKDYSFTFSKEGDINVTGEENISGKWSTGIEKNPTTLNLTLTPFNPFFHLNADWTVTTCKKDRMTFELNGAVATDVLVLSRV